LAAGAATAEAGAGLEAATETGDLTATGAGDAAA
jgi:hypothetical protein